jgi:hypothetical protein
LQYINFTFVVSDKEYVCISKIGESEFKQYYDTLNQCGSVLFLKNAITLNPCPIQQGFLPVHVTLPEAKTGIFIFTRF